MRSFEGLDLSSEMPISGYKSTLPATKGADNGRFSWPRDLLWLFGDVVWSLYVQYEWKGCYVGMCAVGERDAAGVWSRIIQPHLNSGRRRAGMIGWNSMLALLVVGPQDEEGDFPRPSLRKEVPFCDGYYTLASSTEEPGDRDSQFFF